MSALIKEEGLPVPIREFRFTEARRWRGDFVWLNPEKVILEVEGGIWSKGRHIRPKGFLNDIHKYNEAALLGFRVIRVAPEHIESGEAVKWLRRALNPPDD